MKTIWGHTDFYIGSEKKKTDLFETNRKHEIQIEIVLINWQWPQNGDRQTGRLG